MSGEGPSWMMCTRDLAVTSVEQAGVAVELTQSGAKASDPPVANVRPNPAKIRRSRVPAHPARKR